MNSAHGQACIDCLYTSTVESIAQGCTGVLGGPNQGAMIFLKAGMSDNNTLRNTVAHEFGHNLGLGHSCSTDIVMGVGARDVQIPYIDLGYDIPETLPDSTNTGEGSRGIDVALRCLLETHGIYGLVVVVAVLLVWTGRRLRSSRA